MSRKRTISAAPVLLLGALQAYAASPPASPAGNNPLTALVKNSGSTAQSGAVPSPDGNLHVTINTQVTLTKLSPLATKAALMCRGIVGDLQGLSATYNSTIQSISSSCTTTAANSLCPAAFDALWQAYPNAPVQTGAIALTNGGYQGATAVNFTYLPTQLTGYTAPTFMGLCQLQIGNDTGMLPAILDTTGAIQMPSASNMQLVMNGQDNFMVAAPIQFAPL